MYLHVSDALGQPEKEPSREELKELLLLCRRDALLAEGTLQDAMQDLAECRKRLDAAQATLKAAQKRARATRKRRLTK
jgi:hypothetical protein